MRFFFCRVYFTLDGEVGVPIKGVRATQKSNTYLFKAILLLWASAFFAMMCINRICKDSSVMSSFYNRLCKDRSG